ncbi:hypothetical protein GCM10009530_13550 [Microbispora corallina]|uniref:SH3 domain-containing protein n=1 Tax=Microbispora corallina TaxID=83302 RepID=A0ABQ4FT08_9ACTN|nr:hypothetical protein Mco01_09480 [Microbispora corallina]
MAARDLWLRDRYGEPREQLPHGLVVTASGGDDVEGRYRHVTAPGGRDGWVDPSYLRPVC